MNFIVMTPSVTDDRYDRSFWGPKTLGARDVGTPLVVVLGLVLALGAVPLVRLARVALLGGFQRLLVRARRVDGGKGELPLERLAPARRTRRTGAGSDERLEAGAAAFTREIVERYDGSRVEAQSAAQEEAP
jgi:hypothetical protein